MVSFPIKPQTPNHIGEVPNNNVRNKWFESIYDSYEIVYATQTFSSPFPKQQVPSDTKMLRPRLTFKVSLTDIDHIYGLKWCLCADGSTMTEGIYFQISYSPI